MKTLFDETQIGTMKLKNRFFRGAFYEGLADEKGHMTPELSKIYEDLAKGGVGTIFTGYAFITADEQASPRMMGIYSDDFISEYREFTDKIHSLGANIIMQIAYGGTMSNYNIGERIIFTPSDITNELTKTSGKVMTKEDIDKLVEDYGEAALRVKKSGFDGVEIHSAHGYLLSLFLSPYYNKRNDEYGGTIENRARILFEIYQNIRKKVGKDYPIFVKLQSTDGLDNGGLTDEESIYIGKKLAELGVDAIEISGGNASIKDVLKNNKGPIRTGINSIEKESYFKNMASKLAKEVNIPVILIGGNRHFEVMDKILNTTDIQYFSLARALNAETNLINTWKIGDLKKPKCISCNGCLKSFGAKCVLK